MSALSFQFRLHSRHGGPKSIAPCPNPGGPSSESIGVEVLGPEGIWQPLQPSLTTPGFRLFLLSLLLCQHHYLVANAMELAIPLAEVNGRFEVSAAENWIIEAVQGEFQLGLAPQACGLQGLVDPAQLAFLEQRMALCPVSRNLPATVQKRITVTLDQQQSS